MVVNNTLSMETVKVLCISVDLKFSLSEANDLSILVFAYKNYAIKCSGTTLCIFIRNLFFILVKKKFADKVTKVLSIKVKKSLRYGGEKSSTSQEAKKVSGSL